jgi:UDP-N-acetylglucosamine 2-epimerase (non-hydrolysing)
MRILHVVGARPNFIKIAPLLAELRRDPEIMSIMVHTGQHYDERMSAAFFRDLEIMAPDVNLAVGSGSHAAQTAEVMRSFEPVVQEVRPDLLVVVGDVNSTLACALVCAKLGIPVAHVEAGLRSGDRGMPEEINRILTDQLSDLLLTPSDDADQNLCKEGIPPERIHLVGNIMIDSLRRQLPRVHDLNIPRKYGLTPRGYRLATLHRPSNVDDPEQLGEIFLALADLAAEKPLLLPLHPRTRIVAERFQLLDRLGAVQVHPPLGYLDMLGLVESADLVLTDSGGLQEETTALGVPCLTLRASTERPITIEQGSNMLVPIRTRTSILAAAQTAGGKRGHVPELWDGNTAARIVYVFRRWWENHLDASRAQSDGESLKPGGAASTTALV